MEGQHQYHCERGGLPADHRDQATAGSYSPDIIESKGGPDSKKLRTDKNMNTGFILVGFNGITVNLPWNSCG